MASIDGQAECRITFNTTPLTNAELQDAINRAHFAWRDATWANDKGPLWAHYMAVLEEQRKRLSVDDE